MIQRSGFVLTRCPLSLLSVLATPGGYFWTALRFAADSNGFRRFYSVNILPMWLRLGYFAWRWSMGFGFLTVRMVFSHWLLSQVGSISPDCLRTYSLPLL
jgi:hypothetical protein